MDPILVSIDCVAYNHEKFIRDALDGFIMQKTDFRFEVLIYDDASTDSTAEIVREYEMKYPEIIKPIYQTENQYSKGIAVEMFNLDRASGKYIALCEGDDYWTDPHKLQNQVNYMEANPACSMTIHAAEQLAEGRKKKLPIIRPALGNRVFPIEEIIEQGGGFFPTNSVMYRNESISHYPDFYLTTDVGDYPLAIWAAMCGEVHYLDEVWSVYRVGVQGSWTQREFSSYEKRVRHYREVDRMLDGFDAETGFQYTEAVKRTKRKHEFNILMDEGDFKQARSLEYGELFTQLMPGQKAKLAVKYYFPQLRQWIGAVKLRARFK